MWCLLQLPVVHYHLFGLVDVELGGFVVITPTHWPLENSLKSTSLTVSGEEVGLGFFSQHSSPFSFRKSKIQVHGEVQSPKPVTSELFSQMH